MTKIDIKMKKTSFACFILTTLTMTILPAVSSLARTETTKKFEPGQLRQDFQIARQSLEEGHPGLYRHTKKVELDRIFDEAEKSLNHPMDPRHSSLT